MYPDSNLLGTEFEFSESEYPYGPYIGFPSYAHPIILDTLDPLSPNEVLKFWKYPQTEYCNWFSVSIKISSPNFKLLLMVKSLILAFKIALEPEGFTFIIVEVLEYPIPGFTILMSVIFWLVMTGLKSAPDPAPVKSVTTKSGVE